MAMAARTPPRQPVWRPAVHLTMREECAEAGLVFDDNLAGVYVEQALSLQAHEVARDEFAHGAELAGELLVAHGQ